MAIPDNQNTMLPLLKAIADGANHKTSDVIALISKQFNLTKVEVEALLPSGQQSIIANRVGWARTYMKKAGLLTYPKRAYSQITEQGRDLLKKSPTEINAKLLRRYEEFIEFESKTKAKDIPIHNISVDISYSTPEEVLEYGYQKLTEKLSDDILEQIMAYSPDFFERLVVELLIKMGYGGFLKEAASIVGKSGDAGIDGIIKEDKLGLDAIYIQAKRWDGVVGRPEIQKFIGALDGQKAMRASS